MHELSLQAQPYALWPFTELRSFRVVRSVWLRGSPLCVCRGLAAALMERNALDSEGHSSGLRIDPLDKAG